METLFDLIPEPGDSFSTICKTAGIREASNWADRLGAFLQEQQNRKGMSAVRTLSLFSGAGGLDIGFHDVGFDIVQMVELDARFCQTLFANQRTGYFGESSEITIADVTRLGLEVPLKTKSVDLIIGGPPCQPFSAAGRRANGTPGTEREDGQLFNEYIRLLGVCKPTAFVFENVYGITGSQGGRAWAQITNAFENAGYTISHRVLDSADFGVAQHRERMFIIGTRGRTFKFPRPTHGPDSIGDHPFFPAQRAIDGLRTDVADPALEIGGSYGDLMPEIPPGLNYSFFTERMGHPKALFAWRSKFSDFLYKADPAKPVRTIKAQSGKYTGPFHWNSRRFSTDELKRLQTFPDKYELAGSRTIAERQIGNSVPPQIARILALAVAEQVFDCSLPFDISYLAATETLGFRTRKKALSDHYFKTGRESIGRIKKQKKEITLKQMPTQSRIDDDFEAVYSSDGRAIAHRTLEDGALVIRCGRAVEENLSLELRLKPASGLRWDFGVEEVKIELYDRYRQTFISAWKLLELTLNENQIKDSLVQFFGYYAYPPQVTTRFTHHKPLQPFWQSLSRILEGIGTRSVIHGSELSEAIACSEEHLPDILSKLKRYGYEIRNCNTNPTIPPGYYLVPYSFPTLTAVSVQRSKVLFEEKAV